MPEIASSDDGDASSMYRFEQQRLEIEKFKAEHEIIFKDREQVYHGEELLLRKREIELKEQESARAAWVNPAVIGVLAAAVGLASNAFVAWINGQYTREQEARKAEYARVLEMIKVGDPDQAAKNLELLLEAGLYSDADGKLAAYLAHREPGEGGFLPNPNIELGFSDNRTGAPVQRAVDQELIETVKTTLSDDAKKWMTIAFSQIGVAEIYGSENNPRIIEYIKSTGTNIISDNVPWISAFVNWVVGQAGYHGTNSLKPTSWLEWGQSIKTPRPGTIVIASTKGHLTKNVVGFYLANKDNTTIVALTGNVGDQVSTTTINMSDVLGYRWPSM